MRFIFLLLPLLTALLMVSAQTHAKESRSDGPACVDVTVGGYKTLSYECLGLQMTNPQGNTAARKNLEAMTSPITRQAPTRMGLYNQAATRTRMGTNFGTSAFPQRPPAISPRSPLIIGR